MTFLDPHFFPLTPLAMFLLLVLAGVVIAYLEMGVLHYAYEKMGVNRRYVFVFLLLSLLGSSVNIPVAELPADRVISNQEILAFGMWYVIPLVREWPRTVLAVNLGGAVIPTFLSLYLVWKNRIFVKTLLGVAIVTLVVHGFAYPVEGAGITVPIFIPPFVAAGAAMLLTRQSAPALAYVSGSLGVLIGADLLNLDKIQGLGAPVASIGGAGTFDGIFLTGILAVLLAY